MNLHSPAPWTTPDGGSWVYSGNHAICLVDSARADADRALIEAAPELLEACQMALHRFSGELYPGHPELLQLCAAITKATKITVDTTPT